MLIDPVEMASCGCTPPLAPRRMMAPLPNCFSIWPTAISMALRRSFTSSTAMTDLSVHWVAAPLVAPPVNPWLC